MPEPETLFTGDDPLTDVRFGVEEVEKKLKNIKVYEAHGPDRLWSKVLHDMADVLADPLATIFNRLMEEGGSLPSGDWPMSAPSSRRGQGGPCQLQARVAHLCGG